jgi:2-phosphosulfolactate phosphatase
MTARLVIDCFPESAERYRGAYAIVAVDVIRATTTATTALHTGRRVFPARTTDEAFTLAAQLSDPLLVGELGGNMPYGFHETNSPAAIARRTDVHRPMILVSSSGTELIVSAVGSEGVYLACLRNASAVARYVARRHDRVAVIGAGTRGRFRREDQIGCARVAGALLDAGFIAETQETTDCVGRWRNADLEEIRGGASADYLRRSGQEEDLEFVLSHIDDLETVPCLVKGEIRAASVPFEGARAAV